MFILQCLFRTIKLKIRMLSFKKVKDLENYNNKKYIFFHKYFVFFLIEIIKKEYFQKNVYI